MNSTETWKEKWQAAAERAEFYRSERNTKKFWDSAAKNDEPGLPGNEHILLLDRYLTDNCLLGPQVTMADVGCGHGDYALYFADRCKSIAAVDLSDDMLERCRDACAKNGVNNVNCIPADINEYEFTERPDIILACLNPVTYQPHIFEKLLRSAGRCFVYFSMDTPLEGAENEPVYCGTNSVRFAEEYLNESGYSYLKLKYDLTMKRKDGSEVILPFAFLIISTDSCNFQRKTIIPD